MNRYVYIPMERKRSVCKDRWSAWLIVDNHLHTLFDVMWKAASKLSLWSLWLSMILLVLESVLTVSVEMRINKIRQSALVPSLFTSLLLIHFSLSLSSLSRAFFSFLLLWHWGVNACERRLRVDECAIAMLRRSLPSFLWIRSSSCIPLVRVQRKGKRKEKEKYQTLSTVLDIHVCRKTITEAFVCW